MSKAFDKYTYNTPVSLPLFISLRTELQKYIKAVLV